MVDSLRAIWRGLRDWRLYALILLSVLAWGAAYQQKSEYTVDVGGLQDDAFVHWFHGKERTPEREYRWSRGYSVVRFPGVGNQPVQLTIDLIGYRPSGEPPTLEVKARGQRFEVQTRSEPLPVTLFVPRGDPWQGDLEVEFGVPTFVPEGDARELGVIVDRVTVTPADYGLRPVVVPSAGSLGGMLAGVAGLYLTVIAALRSRKWALLSACVLTLLFTLLIVVARPELGLLAPQFLGLGAWLLGLTLVGRWALDRLLRGVAQGRGRDFAVGVGALELAAAFVLRFGGLTYPQFLTSDIILHVHHVQRVVGGQWVFPGYLPDGTEVPYPPALYVLLAPFALLFGTGDDVISLHLKLATSLLDALTCLALAWAGMRLWNGYAGGIAALLYALSPAPFELFSAGNYSNLFSQSILNLTLLGALVYLHRSQSASSRTIVHRPSSIVLLTAGFALTMLGHYGMMLGMVPIVGIFAAWAGYETLRGRPQGSSWALLASWGGALAVSFAAYYLRFLPQMWDQLSGVLSRATGIEPRPSGAVPPAPGVEAFHERLVRRLSRLVGLPALVSAIFGAALPLKMSAAKALLAAWLLASALFLAVDQALGDAVRWYYLAAAPVSLLAGRFLGGLAVRGRASRGLVALVLGASLWLLLTIWVGDLIFTRYH